MSASLRCVRSDVGNCQLDVLSIRPRRQGSGLLREPEMSTDDRPNRSRDDGSASVRTSSLGLAHNVRQHCVSTSSKWRQRRRHGFARTSGIQVPTRVVVRSVLNSQPTSAARSSGSGTVAIPMAASAMP